MLYTAAKPTDAAFSHVFLNFYNCQQEVVSDVISSTVVELTSVKIAVKLGGSWSNPSRDIQLPHFVTNDDNNDAGQRTLCL